MFVFVKIVCIRVADIMPALNQYDEEIEELKKNPDWQAVAKKEAATKLENKFMTKLFQNSTFMSNFVQYSTQK